jgi:hypothetical protein
MTKPRMLRDGLEEKKTRKVVTTELLGYVGVDSGQILIGDPCHCHCDYKERFLEPGEARQVSPNDCGLLFATPYGDGRFRVVGQYEDKVLRSITITV